ncbi:hypothetical protein YJ58_00245 [Salmonella enterica subsp. enterica serovar Enteritidis]|nr:hypothetical protein [Salmonella enterica subsp. enterica serovar Enteritidis]EED7075104.1 hypothetical protein [Salmonella enterica subsp. enterica serovar Enteritidis]
MRTDTSADVAVNAGDQVFLASCNATFGPGDVLVRNGDCTTCNTDVGSQFSVVVDLHAVDTFQQRLNSPLVRFLSLVIFVVRFHVLFDCFTQLVEERNQRR